MSEVWEILLFPVLNAEENLKNDDFHDDFCSSPLLFSPFSILLSFCYMFNVLSFMSFVHHHPFMCLTNSERIERIRCQTRVNSDLTRLLLQKKRIGGERHERIRL